MQNSFSQQVRHITFLLSSLQNTEWEKRTNTPLPSSGSQISVLLLFSWWHSQGSSPLVPLLWTLLPGQPFSLAFPSTGPLWLGAPLLQCLSSDSSLGGFCGSTDAQESPEVQCQLLPSCLSTLPVPSCSDSSAQASWVDTELLCLVPSETHVGV